MPRTTPLPAPVAEELRDCVHMRRNTSWGGMHHERMAPPQAQPMSRETMSHDSFAALEVEQLELVHTPPAGRRRP